MSDPTALALCRDCLAHNAPGTQRCAHCGSPRILAHAELSSLTIAHLDCDAFYAAIEKRDRPELRDKPVIIGGGRRGVVSTACYIARIRGVKSAMPMFKALKLCPDAVVIRPTMAKYVAVGQAVRERMLALTPLVEPISIDEAFMDLAGTERLHGTPPAETLARLAASIERDLGITVSIGLSYNKFLAKVASDFEKPRGFSVIGRGEAATFLADQRITLIHGVGAATEKALAAAGLTHIGQLQHLDEADLMRRFGQMGQRLHRLARGIDDRPVRPRGKAKSISSETTFDADIRDPAQLTAELRRLSEKVAARIKEKDLAVATVVLKLKTADFRTRTRHHQLSAPTRLADRVFSQGKALLEREADGTPFRLIGIGGTDFRPAASADPVDLVDVQATKRASAEGALDALRSRFGVDAIETGYTFGHARREPRHPNTVAARPSQDRQAPQGQPKSDR